MPALVIPVAPWRSFLPQALGVSSAVGAQITMREAVRASKHLKAAKFAFGPPSFVASVNVDRASRAVVKRSACTQGPGFEPGVFFDACCMHSSLLLNEAKTFFFGSMSMIFCRAGQSVTVYSSSQAFCTDPPILASILLNVAIHQ